MKIRTKLLASVMVSFVLALVTGVVIFAATKEAQKAVDKMILAQQIVKEIFELNTLTNDYVMYHEERPRLQWQIKRSDIDELLLSEKFADPFDEEIIGKVRENLVLNQNIFERVNSHQLTSSSHISAALSPELEQRLSAQLLANSQSMIADISRLVEKSVEDRSAIRVLADRLIIILITLLTLIKIFFSLWIYRSVINPMATLKQGMNIIGRGHLNYKIKLKSNDEISELAHFFNVMTSQLHQIDKAKTEFVSLASHQLRTPPATIKWYCEALLAQNFGPLSPKQKEYLEEVYQSNKRMIDLIDSLLAVSRIEIGAFTVTPEPTHLDGIMDDILGELKIEIANKKLKIGKNYRVHDAFINTDPKLVRIIFQNLLSNAVDYSREGGKIAIEMKKDKNGLDIKIIDNGCGIPKNAQAKIFTKFYRADNARIIKPDGSGIGLYMIKSITEGLGGTIGFQSSKSGTTFFVHLRDMDKKG